MNISRRRFLAGFGAAGVAIGVDAFGVEATRVLVSRHDVQVPGLPPALAGLRIAQVTDVHFPGNRLAARAALEHLHRERVEVVILNGDMTESSSALNQVRDFAAEARGSLATVAVLGNWEYRAGAVGDVARATYRQAAVDLLINQAKVLNVEGTPLALVGLTAWKSGSGTSPSLRTRFLEKPQPGRRCSSRATPTEARSESLCSLR
jgi:predicted MPP superfamily phosphohydrolase